MEGTITEKVIKYLEVDKNEQPFNFLDIKVKSNAVINKNLKIVEKRGFMAEHMIRFNAKTEKKEIRKTIDIGGVEFIIDIEEGVYILSHQRWSLIGNGKTLYEAITNLFEEAKNILKNYLDVPLSNMTMDAIQFREFLLRLL